MTSITLTQNSEKLWLFHPLLNHFLSRQLLSPCLSKLRPKATSATRHSDTAKLAFPRVMLKLPDPVSTGSHPEALPVSLHISAEVSGSSMGATKFPRATLQGEAKKTPHLFFVLSLAGPDMQRARCTAFSFLSSLLISAENREGSSQRAVCFSLVFSPGIPLKREDRSLQGSPAKETFSLFTFWCFSLCSLFLVGLFSPRHKESSFGAFQCQIIQCKHSHLYYHQYSALQFQQQMNDTVHKKKTNAAND